MKSTLDARRDGGAASSPASTTVEPRVTGIISTRFRSNLVDIEPSALVVRTLLGKK